MQANFNAKYALLVVDDFAPFNIDSKVYFRFTYKHGEPMIADDKIGG